jgi:hypothetical protein
MDYERAAAEFLARPENLPIALEVAKRIEQTKNYLQIRFWHMYRDEMEHRLYTAKHSQQWQVSLERQERLLDPYAKCLLVPAKVRQGAVYLRVTLEAQHPRNEYNFIYGLCWSTQYGATLNPIMAEEMVKVLKTISFAVNPSDWWLTYVSVGQRLREDTFLVRFTSEPEEAVNEIADIVWSFFGQIREPLEALNESLSHSSV